MDTLEYMEQWRNSEDWDVLNIYIDEGHDMLAADYLVGAGGIDSRSCYPEYKAVEREIESLADQFRKLPHAQQRRLESEALSGCHVFSCEACGHVSFLKDGNEKLYEDELKQCWSCKSDKVTHRIY